jgi:hypothetical protein
MNPGYYSVWDLSLTLIRQWTAWWRRSQTRMLGIFGSMPMLSRETHATRLGCVASKARKAPCQILRWLCFFDDGLISSGNFDVCSYRNSICIAWILHVQNMTMHTLWWKNLLWRLLICSLAIRLRVCFRCFSSNPIYFLAYNLDVLYITSETNVVCGW